MIFYSYLFFYPRKQHLRYGIISKCHQLLKNVLQSLEILIQTCGHLYHLLIPYPCPSQSNHKMAKHVNEIHPLIHFSNINMQQYLPIVIEQWKFCSFSEKRPIFFTNLLILNTQASKGMPELKWVLCGKEVAFSSFLMLFTSESWGKKNHDPAQKSLRLTNNNFIMEKIVASPV